MSSEEEKLEAMMLADLDREKEVVLLRNWHRVGHGYAPRAERVEILTKHNETLRLRVRELEGIISAIQSLVEPDDQR